VEPRLVTLSWLRPGFTRRGPNRSQGAGNAHEVKKGTHTLTPMKGFTRTQQHQKTASYWISCYSQENEDEPFGISKKVLVYKPGQDKDKLILEYCRELMRINCNIWEVLVHQGPDEVPGHGDQITLRMSREKFRGSTTIA
jgi:hypothetical protein